MRHTRASGILLAVSGRGSNWAGGREDILEEGFEFPAMIARSGVDDDGSVLAVAVDLPHAVSVPFQTPSDLRGSECHVQAIAFDPVHRNAMSAFG